MKKNLKLLGLGVIMLFLLGPFSTFMAPVNAANDALVLQRADTLSSVLDNYLFLRLNVEVDPPKMDTISYLYNQYIGELDFLNDESVPMRYIAYNPNYYRLLVPLVYYNSPVSHFTLPELEPLQVVKEPEWKTNILSFDKKSLTKLSRVNKIVDRTLMDLYMADIGAVKTTEDRIMGQKIYYTSVPEDKDVSVKTISPLFRPDEDLESDLNKVENYIRRPNWWLTGGSGSLQVTQNYISENWHKGGESTNSVLGNLQLFANYNDRERIQFENIFEAKIGFNTVSSDTVRKYRINADMVRISSKLGIRAASTWYYTLSTEANTQFVRNYKKNSDELVSAFLSPANLILSLGMDYKLKKRNVNLSVIISPASYNFRYVHNHRVDVTKFGLKEGRRTLHDVGSKLESRMEWKIASFIEWKSRLWFFTNYKRAEGEWENSFDFILNRYLSTKLFVHARFDDGVTRVGDRSYFQLKEMLSFGLNYRW